MSGKRGRLLNGLNCWVATFGIGVRLAVRQYDKIRYVVGFKTISQIA